MEIPELISLLEAKLKAKLEEFQKTEKETAMAKHALFSDLRSLESTMAKVRVNYPAVTDYFPDAVAQLKASGDKE